MSRRLLQVFTAALGLVPVGTGLVGLSGLRDPLYTRFGVVPNIVLDSNLRFFSGFWLGAGIAIFAIIPRIEKHGTLFRALWGMIFLGGIGRLISIFDAGAPPLPFFGVLLLEIVGAPFFILWHRRVERASASSR